MANLKKVAVISFIIAGLIWMTLGIVGQSGRVAKLAIGITCLLLGLGQLSSKSNRGVGE